VHVRGGSGPCAKALVEAGLPLIDPVPGREGRQKVVGSQMTTRKRGSALAPEKVFFRRDITNDTVVAGSPFCESINIERAIRCRVLVSNMICLIL
jgi:hypothetical protein